VLFGEILGLGEIALRVLQLHGREIENALIRLRGVDCGLRGREIIVVLRRARAACEQETTGQRRYGQFRSVHVRLLSSARHCVRSAAG
jgi:hypothetical protein